MLFIESLMIFIAQIRLKLSTRFFMMRPRSHTLFSCLGDVAIPAPTGLQKFEKATETMRAECWLCGIKIKAPAWRFDYRFKASTTLRDQRRVHARCVGGLPAVTRSEDQRFVRHAFGVATDLEAREMLQRVAFDLGFEV